MCIHCRSDNNTKTMFVLIYFTYASYQQIKGSSTRAISIVLFVCAAHGAESIQGNQEIYLPEKKKGRTKSCTVYTAQPIMFLQFYFLVVIGNHLAVHSGANRYFTWENDECDFNGGNQMNILLIFNIAAI